MYCDRFTFPGLTRVKIGTGGAVVIIGPPSLRDNSRISSETGAVNAGIERRSYVWVLVAAMTELLGGAGNTSADKLNSRSLSAETSRWNSTKRKNVENQRDL